MGFNLPLSLEHWPFQCLSFQNIGFPSRSEFLIENILTYYYPSASWRVRNSCLPPGCQYALLQNTLLPKPTPHHRPPPRLPTAHAIRSRKIHSQRHETRAPNLHYPHNSHPRRTRRGSRIPHKLEHNHRIRRHFQNELRPQSRSSTRGLLPLETGQR